MQGLFLAKLRCLVSGFGFVGWRVKGIEVWSRIDRGDIYRGISYVLHTLHPAPLNSEA